VLLLAHIGHQLVWLLYAVPGAAGLTRHAGGLEQLGEPPQLACRGAFRQPAEDCLPHLPHLEESDRATGRLAAIFGSDDQPLESPSKRVTAIL
jgi:hypothetical protein